MRAKRIALVIPASLSQPIRAEQIHTALATRQTLVEGNVEAITGKDWHVYLNDEADSIPLPLTPGPKC